MQFRYIKHEQKECQKKKKNCTVSCRPAPWCAVRPQSSNFDVTSSLLFILFLLSRVSCSFDSAESWAERVLLKKPIEEHCFLPCFSGPLQSTLGVVSPSSVSSVVPFDLCCAQLFSPLIMRCSHTLKKAQRHPPEVKWSLACFLLLVFQWEASQTNPPSLHYLLWYLQNDDQLLSLCHRFWAKSTHNPSSLLEGQNCVWICCRERSTAGSRFPSSAFILVKLQQCTCYQKSIWL